jgi:polysaccharide biosynthesis protein PslH
MRVLWVKPGGLWPGNTGGRLRSLHMVRELSKSHDVTVLTTHSSNEDTAMLRENLPHCIDVRSFVHDPVKRGTPQFLWALARSWASRYPLDVLRHSIPELKQEATRRMSNGSVDLCVADFLYAMPNIPLSTRVPIVLFEHNVEYMIWKRFAALEKWPARRIILEMEWRKMCRFEVEACRIADITVAV